MRVLVDPSKHVAHAPPSGDEGWSPYLDYLWRQRSLQQACEFDAAMDEIEKRIGRPKAIVEIGSYRRGTTLRMMDRFKPELVVGVSLPMHSSVVEEPLIRRWAEAHDIAWVEVQVDSSVPWVKAYVAEIVQGHGLALDLLFIDGDHTAEGVHADWDNFGPLVRMGGATMFHDTYLPGPIHDLVQVLDDPSWDTGSWGGGPRRIPRIEFAADPEANESTAPLGVTLAFHAMEILS